MIRDGKLIDREPGFLIAYEQAPVGFDPPAVVTLPESSGTVWDPTTNIGTICTQGCHGGPGGYTSWYPRTPHYDASPEIAQVYGQVGSGVLTVTFSEPVWSLIGGNLGAGDFILTDLDNERTILAVTHTAGDSLAQFFLSSTLDGTDDINTDMVTAKPGIVYDENGQSMQPDFVLITDDDNTGPTAGDFDPATLTTGVYGNENLTFSLSDASSSVDWSTFSIQLTGSLGYSQLYTDSDTDAVSKTGTRWKYDVTIDPRVDFSSGETITVTLNVTDEVGNVMAPPDWSFKSEGGAAETMILHPSGLNTLVAVNWVTNGGGWDTVLDSDDGNSTRVTGYSVGYAYFDIDDPVGLGGATIESVTIYTRAKISGFRGAPATGDIDIGYKTGTTLIEETGKNLPATGDYTLVNTATFTTDSDGGSLDLTDLNDLTIYTEYPVYVTRRDLFMTEVYAEVVYTP